jgi:hypothetical protein
MRRAAIVSALLVAGCVVLRAQAPDFAGTWRLDPAKSRVTPAAGLAGLIPNGAPETLHITQPSNGTLVIESQINEGHARMYRPGGKTSTPAGQGGSITMTSKWEGRALVSEGTQESPTGASTRVREVMALGADGRSLIIDVTTAGAAGPSASSLVYARTKDVGSCQSWPTPCKILPR